MEDSPATQILGWEAQSRVFLRLFNAINNPSQESKIRDVVCSCSSKTGFHKVRMHAAGGCQLIPNLKTGRANKGTNQKSRSQVTDRADSLRIETQQLIVFKKINIAKSKP